MPVGHVTNAPRKYAYFNKKQYYPVKGKFIQIIKIFH